MTAYRHIEVSAADGIVTVRMVRDATRNAMNLELMQELTRAARDLRDDAEVRAVILTGAAGYFSAGADLKALIAARERALQGASPDMEALRALVRAGPDMCKAWEEIRAVTIAAIEGFCIGGGVALVVACDFRIVGAGATMRLPEVPLGVNMSWQSIPRLTRLIGPARTKRMVMFGETYQAVQIMDWGLGDEVSADGETLSVARRWAQSVADMPALPVRMTKEAVNMAAGADAHAVSYMDADQFLLTVLSAEFGARATAFTQRRP